MPAHDSKNVRRIQKVPDEVGSTTLTEAEHREMHQYHIRMMRDTIAEGSRERLRGLARASSIVCANGSPPPTVDDEIDPDKDK